MRIPRLWNAYAWFALGAWLGSIVAGIAEDWLREPSPQAAAHELPRELIGVLYIPLCLMLSLIFVAWLAIRLRSGGRGLQLSWTVPLVLGLSYFPLLFGAIAVVVGLSSEGRGVLVGSAILTVLLALPAAAGEIAYRRGAQSPLAAE